MTGDDLDDVDPFDDKEVPDDPEQSPVAGPADPLFGGVDVTALAGELIKPAVHRAVAAQLDELAGEAVRDALTPAVLDQLRADAEDAAQTLVHGPSPAQAPYPSAIEPVCYTLTDGDLLLSFAATFESVSPATARAPGAPTLKTSPGSRFTA